MISSTSCQGNDENKKFVLDVLDHLRREGAEYGSRWRGPASPAELSKIIVEYCVSTYEKKYRFDIQGPTQDTDFQQEKLNHRTKEGGRSGGTKSDNTRHAKQGEAKGEAKDGKTRSKKQGEDGLERSIRQFFSDSINKIVRYPTLDASE